MKPSINNLLQWSRVLLEKRMVIANYWFLRYYRSTNNCLAVQTERSVPLIQKSILNCVNLSHTVHNLFLFCTSVAGYLCCYCNIQSEVDTMSTVVWTAAIFRAINFVYVFRWRKERKANKCLQTIKLRAEHRAGRHCLEHSGTLHGLTRVKIKTILTFLCMKKEVFCYSFKKPNTEPILCYALKFRIPVREGSGNVFTAAFRGRRYYTEWTLGLWVRISDNGMDICIIIVSRPLNLVGVPTSML
jgi:hypothetical protein